MLACRLRVALMFLVVLTLIQAAASAAERSQRQPNIVLIFIDDMGWKDTGYSGSDLYETPHIDQLAQQGMVFNSAYASAGNCQPSRACLISGQYTPRHGTYAVWSTKRGKVSKMRLEPVPNADVLPASNFTIGEAMKAAGYATGMFGKWHVGDEEGTRPQDQGFDVVDSMDPSSKKSQQAGDPKWIYRITNGACDFIENHQDEPFFAYVSHHATHMPVQAREDMFAKFNDKGPQKLHRHTKFAAMNGQVDDGVGLIMKKLEELDLVDNTLVLFTSDNGALPQSPPKPLRGYKGMYYEGGVRVPMIVRWPSVVKAGSTCDTPVINVDFYTTFLAAAGKEPPRDKTLDGANLMPLLSGQESLEREAIFWHFPGYLDRANPGSRDKAFRARPQTAMRKGDWKIHLFHEEWLLDGGADRIGSNRCVELYNLADDIGETNDLANSYPDKRDELLADVLVWLEATQAPMPTLKVVPTPPSNQL